MATKKVKENFIVLDEENCCIIDEDACASDFTGLHVGQDKAIAAAKDCIEEEGDFGCYEALTVYKLVPVAKIKRADVVVEMVK